uniref:Lipocalin/cytosolic fatty-acid binding domain-containing protein n=1 Tax=Catagonus wagneri TaxID=51154 RepID=A0A8C3X723_9CETA
AKMKLLLLCLGLTLGCSHKEEDHNVVTSNFNVSKIAGEWYSILLASDAKEKIEENGSMRVFVERINVLNNFSLDFKFQTKVNGECIEFTVVCDKIGDGVYTVDYDGDNKFRILEVNYSDYIILHLVNVNGNKTFQLMELYGRKPDVRPELKNKFVEICQRYGIIKENILDLTKIGEFSHLWASLPNFPFC